MIQINNLTKNYGDVKALDSLTMHVGKGQIYGLVGPNGAGKSTLIRHLTGALRQDAGEILIDGQSVYENDEIKSRIAYIPDDIFFFAQANIKDMMKFYKSIYPKFDEELFYKLKDCFGALDLRKNIRSFSKGMQKQAAFLLAVCCRADLMILDEPVDGLDPVMRRQIWNIILNDVAEHGLTVLVSSHNLRELEDICDHVGIMDRGRILIERSLTDLQASIVKIQVVFENGMPDLPDDITVLHKSSAGRVHSLIIKGEPLAAQKRIEELNPIIMDVLPLTLEEIFIYELGGADYEIKDILF